MLARSPRVIARLTCGVAIALFGSFAPNLAQAQWLGPETDGLRAIREAEERMLPEQTLIEDALSREDHPDWLSGLTRPDLPLRFTPAVNRFLEYFKNDERGHAIMASWVRRSTRYDQVIRSELRSASLPEDLRCVAMIESGYDPTARSGAGAVGMWQFVGPTARELGLVRDFWFDQRRDPQRSTEAAARYLRWLKDRFGSWELSLAAYNMGYGALLRALRKHNTNDYWVVAERGGLPHETTRYVPKAMACAVVLRNLELFGFTDRDAPLTMVDVPAPAGRTLDELAAAAGITVTQLRELNPHLRRDRVPPTQPSLRVSREDVDAARVAWATLPSDHRTHVLRYGETTRDVAWMYNMTLGQLRSINGVSGGEDVPVLTSLLVPDVDPRDGRREGGRLVVPVRDVPGVPGRTRLFYRALAGDTIAKLAEIFEVSEAELLSWNHVTPDARIPTGIVLQVYVDPQQDLSQVAVLGPSEVHLMTIGSDEYLAYHAGFPGRVRVIYEVEPGDTLSEIAARFDLAVEELAAINGFDDADALRIGQPVTVYAPTANAAPPVSETR